MTQTANNYGEVLFELGIKKGTVEESKRIFSLTELWKVPLFQRMKNILL